MTNLIPPTTTELCALYRDEGSSFMDALVAVYRRRWIFLGICAVCVMGALVYWAIRPVIYAYTTTIEIGTTLTEEEGKKRLIPLEPPKSVIAKLEQGFIPAVIQELRAKDATLAPLMIKAVAPKETELVTLESLGRDEDSEIHMQAQNAIAQRLVEDHKRRIFPIRIELQRSIDTAKLKLDELQDINTLELRNQQIKIPLVAERTKLERLRDPRVFGVFRQEANDQLRLAKMKLDELQDPRVIGVPKKALEAQVETAKLTLQELEDGQKLIRSEIAAMDEKKQLLDRQIKSLADQIAETDTHRQKAIGSSKGETWAMAILLMDNEIQQNRNRLATLEDRLYIDLPDQRQKLEKRLEDNRREREIQQGKVVQLEGQLTKFLVDNQREQEKQRLMIAQLESQLQKLEVDNLNDQTTSTPILNELEVKARKLVPDHSREISAQKQLISELRQKLENMRETHVVVAPIRSIAAKGTAGVVVMAMASMLGFIAGLLAVVLVEYWLKAKTRIIDEATVQTQNEAFNVR